jgi:hypothetical protein
MTHIGMAATLKNSAGTGRMIACGDPLPPVGKRPNGSE